MSKKKVIVKRLNSIQNFGAIDILCTDKTGTLTPGSRHSRESRPMSPTGIARTCSGTPT